MGKNSSRPAGMAAAPRGRSQQFQLPDLPESVLVSILKCVRTRDRLSSCSLVCKAWAAAATAATTDLNDGRAALKIVGPESCRGLQVWMEQFVQQVQRINLKYSRASRTESYNAPAARVALPICQLTRLQSLELKKFSFMFSTQPPAPYSTRSRSRRSAGHFLTAAGGGAGSSRSTAYGTAAGSTAAAVLPELRELQLTKCGIRLDSFQQLSKLSSLTRLALSQTDIRSRSWAVIPTAQFTAAITAVLQGLTGLQELSLGDSIHLENPVVALAPLSTMQHLQSVTFSPDACNTAALAHLPTTLTSLALIDPQEDYDLFYLDLAATPESLPQLTLLKNLELSGVQLQPQVLARFNGLRTLRLDSVALLPAPPGDDADGEDELQPGHASEVAVLEALQQFTQLKSLELTSLDLGHVEDLQLFSSLTASTQLTGVSISSTYKDDDTTPSPPIPRGAMQHMLREGMELPLLKALRLEVEEFDFSLLPPPCVDTRDIKRMAGCLPALEELSLIGVVKGHGAVAALTHLVPRLKQLRVSGDGFDDRRAGLVAKLTSLVTLKWTTTDVTPRGVQKLTALTGLKSLVVRDCTMLGLGGLIEKGPNAGMMGWSSWDDRLALFSSEEADAAGIPDVYLQVQRHFANHFLNKPKGGCGCK